MSDAKLDLPTWLTPAGEKLSCIEKIKVLNENLQEIQALAQEAMEDAILMGGDETQFRQVIETIAQSLTNPYRKDGK
jgi:uncharacterized protein (UPF0335 family)